MRKSLKHSLVNIINQQFIDSIGAHLFGYGIPVFMLHRISNDCTSNHKITSTYLRKCLKYLKKNNFSFLSLEEAILRLRNRMDIPRKSIVFTMDDGFIDQLEIAAPVFLEYNCPATIFLITGMIDNKLWPYDDKVSYMINTSTCDSISLILNGEQHNLSLKNSYHKKMTKDYILNIIKASPTTELPDTLEQLEKETKTSIPSIPPDEYKPITWDMAREYEKKGIMFAPHSKSHYTLSRLGDKSVEDEIITSWQRISDEIERPSPVFCYPTGRFCDYGPREINILKNNDFIGAVSTFPAQIELGQKSDNYYYNLPRFCLTPYFDDFLHDISWLGYIRNKSHLYNHY